MLKLLNVITDPSITYKAKVTFKHLIEKLESNAFFSNPMDKPNPTFTVVLCEPFILDTVIIPDESLGGVMWGGAYMEKIGVQKSSTNIENIRIMIQC